ncbi:MAG: tetratricopeptide repeat protein [Acidobacteriia bacterium]|nr:tetratricopeptide repeat protein [Terriglobia bacterium]
MLRYLLPLLAASAVFAAAPVYELSGRIVHPRSRATVSLFGTASPFSASTFVYPGYSFHFKKLPPGAYTLTVFMRNRGEARQTVEVGPSTAGRRGRLFLDLELKDSDFELSSALRRHTVSAKQLAIPAAALRDFREAQNDLAKRKVEAAVARLEDAVDRAPQFSAAWNNLGTIAYQGANYARAEECFREAVEQDPQSFEALVNLGGVLVTLRKLDEALDRNGQAALLRPNDALAQSQLGMTYFLVGNLELAKKHLERAREIDPAHFSYPQLILYRIHLTEGDPVAAADSLDDFLAHHPDWPEALAARKIIAELRSR